MKFAALVLLAATLACASSPPVSPTAPAAPVEVQMRPYIMVVLRRGPAWTPEKTPENLKLSEGHMANIFAMQAAGKLLIAGPFDAPENDRSSLAGIFIFDVTERAEVEALLKNDPAVVAQRFVPEIMSWYGPAGLTYAGKR